MLKKYNLVKTKLDLHQHLQQTPDVSRLSFNYVIDLIRGGYNKKDKSPVIVGVVNFRDINPDGSRRDDRRYEDIVSKADHNSTRNIGNAVFLEDIVLVKVQEVPIMYGSKEVHCLFAGLKENDHITPRRGIKETLDEAEEKNAVVIWDHPFSRAGIGPSISVGKLCLKGLVEEGKTFSEEVLSRTHGIEVYNALVDRHIPFIMPKNANSLAQDMYEFIFPYYRIGGVVGTDGQFLNALKNPSYSFVKFPEFSQIGSSQELVDSLKESISNCNFRYSEKVTNPQSRSVPLRHLLNMVREEGVIKLARRAFGS